MAVEIYAGPYLKCSPKLRELPQKWADLGFVDLRGDYSVQDDADYLTTEERWRKHAFDAKESPRGYMPSEGNAKTCLWMEVEGNLEPLTQAYDRIEVEYGIVVSCG